MLSKQISRLLRRAPWRTALSFFLIFLMAFLLSLGVGLRAGNRRVLERAGEDYTGEAAISRDLDVGGI
ncbi:MAG: hypothetical protein MJ141_08555, partial [Clostridia bacterium]|nr:hypothetical protein [Clostridia bacterium]